MSRTLPNFIIGGAGASGTSFLVAALIQHPEVYLATPVVPEPHFFFKSWLYEQGIDYYINRWFSDVPDRCIAIGERSSSYSYGGHRVASRIVGVLPKMKFIFTIRSPIERAWASYRFTTLQGLEPLSFEEALKKEKKRIASEVGIWKELQIHDYTGRSFYAKHFKEFMYYFPRSQMLILKAESLSSDMQTELTKVYDFLGLTDREFKPDIPPEFNSVSVIDRTLQVEIRKYFGDRMVPIIEAIRTHQPTENLVNPLELEIVDRLKNNLKTTKDPLPQHIRVYLREVFSEDMEKLKPMIDFDISDWK